MLKSHNLNVCHYIVFLESIQKGSLILKVYETVVVLEAYATLTFS